MNLSKVTQWFASVNAVAFTLFVGVLFLFTNYQSVIFRVSPENAMPFIYPFWVRVVIAHLDSFFFSFATVTIIFQCKNEGWKVLFCFFEATMLCLNLTQKYNPLNDFYIAIYVGIFSGFTFYILGSLAKMHLATENAPINAPQNVPINAPQIVPTNTPQNVPTNALIDSEKVNAIMNESTKYAFLRKYNKVVECLNSGQSIAQTAKTTKISESTIKKVRQTLKELEFSITP